MPENPSSGAIKGPTLQVKFTRKEDVDDLVTGFYDLKLSRQPYGPAATSKTLLDVSLLNVTDKEQITVNKTSLETKQEGSQTVWFLNLPLAQTVGGQPDITLSFVKVDEAPKTEGPTELTPPPPDRKPFNKENLTQLFSKARDPNVADDDDAKKAKAVVKAIEDRAAVVEAGKSYEITDGVIKEATTTNWVAGSTIWVGFKNADRIQPIILENTGKPDERYIPQYATRSWWTPGKGRLDVPHHSDAAIWFESDYTDPDTGFHDQDYSKHKPAVLTRGTSYTVTYTNGDWGDVVPVKAP